MKKAEFNCHLYPSNLSPCPRLSSSNQDSWLLSRLSPNSGCKEDTHKQAATEDQTKVDIDTDSGLDSTQEDPDKATPASDDIHGEEMQERRLNMRGRNCRNITGARPRIPTRLGKVTKV